MEKQKDISVIVPVSERYDDVRELYGEYRDALENSGLAYEFIYVLDGEFPEVFEQLRSLQKEGESIRIIALSKMFGEAIALDAGFKNSSGEYILTLPAYYQVAPEELSKVFREMRGCDMIVGRRWPRVDSLFNRIQTGIFTSMVKGITGTDFKDLGCSVRVFRRQVIDEVTVYGDQHRFLPVLAGKMGFKIREIDLAQSKKDKFTWVYRLGVYPRRMLDMLTVFFLVKFTKKPLRFFGLIGVATFTAGGLFLLVVVLERLIIGTPLTERPAMLLSSLLVVLGVQIFALGLIGELIIFTHAKDLKEYTVEEVVN